MAEELSSQAEQLARTIGFFKVDREASRRDASATSSRSSKSPEHVQAGKAPAKLAKALPDGNGHRAVRMVSAAVAASGDDDFEEY